MEGDESTKLLNSPRIMKFGARVGVYAIRASRATVIVSGFIRRIADDGASKLFLGKIIASELNEVDQKCSGKCLMIRQPCS